jgi:hypothetical protein
VAFHPPKTVELDFDNAFYKRYSSTLTLLSPTRLIFLKQRWV